MAISAVISLIHKLNANSFKIELTISGTFKYGNVSIASAVLQEDRTDFLCMHVLARRSCTSIQLILVLLTSFSNHAS